MMFRNQWGLWLPLISCLSCFWHMRLQASFEGFISLDCGKQKGSGYSDESTNIHYLSDEEYISTGEIHNVSSEYNSDLHGEQARDLRSFPFGARNCYSISVSPNYSKFLVRAWFLYGNYDGLQKPPKFDLHLGPNLWSTVEARNDSYLQYKEAITVVDSGRNVTVCLVNTLTGVPFISALEVRPLFGNIYEPADNMKFMVHFTRLDVNGDNTSIGRLARYSSDPFDRVWERFMKPAVWRPLSTGENIAETDGYAVPIEVLQSAAFPKEKEQLSFCWGEVKGQFLAYIYVVEMESLPTNDTRMFKIRFEPTQVSNNVTLKHNAVTTVTWDYPNVISNPNSTKKLEIEFVPASDSNHQPIVSALEVYTLMNKSDPETDKKNVDAINDIKFAFNVKKSNWAGDPCSPKAYVWSGLNCNYAAGSNPKITGLNLSSSGLTGEISSSFKDLDALESLDLSKNNLHGRIPDFLGNLPLKFLDLSSNKFEGPIPKSLKERPFEFRYGNNPDLCVTANQGSCKRNSIKLVVAIICSVAALLVIVLLILLIVRRQKKRKQGEVGYAFQGISYAIETETSGSSQYGMNFRHKSRRFTFAELLKITNHFNKVIGKGGFGFVYHGVLDSGSEVAVKQLSHSSSQGLREFLKEVQLLSRIHHRNLVSLVGYCDDVQHLALVYEYMSNGSLKDHLSGKSSDARLSSWRERLRIATEVCQGLEYLHKGCKPSIIHRDVKTSNILLNHNMEAKLADFGLSKIFQNDPSIDHHSHVSTSVMGTPGYLDPEYSSTNQLTEKSDVYSFGIVLLELITGLDAIIKQEYHIHIVQLVEPILQKGEVSKIIDKAFHEDYEINSVWKAIEIALSCTHNENIGRPSITEVLIQLKDCLELEDHGKISSSNLDVSSNSGIDMPPLHDSLIGFPRAR